MYNVKDIAKLTGLKEPFVRRCIRELKDIFDPHIEERGAKNSLMLSPSIIPVFEKIKQDKANGLSLPAIKNLLSSDVLVIKQVEKNFDKKLSNTTNYYSNDKDEWINIKEAAYLSKKSEATVRRLITKLKNADDFSLIKKDKEKWLIKKHLIFEHFGVDSQTNLRTHMTNHDDGLRTHMANHNDDMHTHNEQNTKEIIDLLKNQINEFKKQIELKDEQKDEQLEKQAVDFKIQIAELKEQSNKKDIKIEKQVDDFKDLLSQKDQQIHQLHVLLKESKISNIEYKPDENLGVFSKVLMRFGL